jgi:ArsR family transcriptional regulator
MSAVKIMIDKGKRHGPGGRHCAELRLPLNPIDELLMVVGALRALADETRFRIAGILGPGPMTVCQIAEELEVPQSLVSYHLTKLKEARLVSTRRVGKWNHCFLNRRLVWILVRAVADPAPERPGWRADTWRPP